MLNGGNITVYVAEMDRAVRFYTETLGLRLRERFGDHWAAVDAGAGLIIGLHPATREISAGRPGSMAIGFEATAPIEQAVTTLTARGVTFSGGVVGDKAGKFAFFADPDGNPCYLFQMSAAPAR
jgi:catechol 2,3-dioxygenase-like lactoylglutathione lyase family enzyme